MEEKLLSSALLVSPKCFSFEMQHGLGSPTEALPIRMFFLFQRLWDTAKTRYQRIAAGITDANTDAGYQVNQVKQTQNNAMWSFCRITRTVLQKVT